MAAAQLWILILALLLTGTACKKETPAKAPAPKGARDGGADPGSLPPSGGRIDDQDDEEEEEEEEEPDEIELSIAPESLGALKISGGAPANIRFILKGDEDKDVVVGLSEAPAGVALSKSGSTVTFAWVSPLKGSHTLRFILRDRELCEAEESDPADCEIKAEDYGKIGAKSYDVTSERFTLEVGTGSGSGGSGGAGGGGNGDLIAQIIDLLGGGGNLQGLLSGLSTTQLNQILGLAQGGLDLGSIMSLLGL